MREIGNYKPPLEALDITNNIVYVIQFFQFICDDWSLERVSFGQKQVGS